MVEFSIKTPAFEFLLKVEAAALWRFGVQLYAVLWLAGSQIGTSAQLQAFIWKAVVALYQIVSWLGMF